jgi:protein subunit release factor A
MKRVIEIKAAEGGEDAKLFVKTLATMYKNYCNRMG